MGTGKTIQKNDTALWFNNIINEWKKLIKNLGKSYVLKEGLISQSLLVYNLLRKVVGAENSDLPSVKY